MTDPASLAPPHLLEFLRRHGVDVEFVAPGVPMPTVASAAAAVGVPEEQILKTLLFAAGDQYVVAIASGTGRVSRSLLAEVSGLVRPRAANPDLVAEITGFPAGGVAAIALPEELPVIVDVSVARVPAAYGGGGREDLLLRIATADVIRLNNALVRRIVEDSATHPA
jgi:prolyl-tRNA editing enzyme YbaK/EbsC (Cys-tRNA(Pro) deacylase)